MNITVKNHCLKTIFVFNLIVCVFTARLVNAEANWSSGTSQGSTILDCFSSTNGSPLLEAGANAYADMYVDPDNLPKVGETFYVRGLIQGLGDTCIGQKITPEFLLPVGVNLAISASAPVYCSFVNMRTGESQDVSSLCSSNPPIGDFGGFAFYPQGQNVNTWPLNRDYAFLVALPVVSTRVLRGINSTQPLCSSRENLNGPCVTSQAGDHLQVAFRVKDGNSNPVLTPFIGLLTLPNPNTTSPVSPAITSISIPKTLTKTSISKSGISFQIKTTTAGRGVRVSAYIGSKLVAKITKTSLKSGKNSFVFKISSKKIVFAKGASKSIKLVIEELLNSQPIKTTNKSLKVS